MLSEDNDIVTINQFIEKNNLTLDSQKVVETIDELGISVFYHCLSFGWVKLERNRFVSAVVSREKYFTCYDPPNPPMSGRGSDFIRTMAYKKRPIEQLGIQKKDVQSLISSLPEPALLEEKKLTEKVSHQAITRSETLYAVLQVLAEDYLKNCDPKKAKYAKKRKGTRSINIAEIVRSIDDVRHRWWESDSMGKTKPGLSIQQIEDNLSKALRFKKSSRTNFTKGLVEFSPGYLIKKYL